jgi:hypothetical protein
MNYNPTILINQLIALQEEFYHKYGVNDIYTNSKIFEIMIADRLNHQLIPGHSGSRDGKDKLGEYEYKHYKESSSNHTWTFNDFSDTTILKLNSCYAVLFCHINDLGQTPYFDWYYQVPGKLISQYLSKAVQKITNTRKMINVSIKQIEQNLGIKRISVSDKPGEYAYYLNKIFKITQDLEKSIDTKNILTSNKIWELLISLHTGHKILSEQKKHDAIDKSGNYYEYKVSKSYSWSFEDISPTVLKKFNEESEIILARVDKEKMTIESIFSAEPKRMVKLLNKKLKERKNRYNNKNKEIRRLQVTVNLKDLKSIKAKQIL